MQSGTWAVIGFPLEEQEARTKFYTYANWSYQAGVFISRSSGTFYQASLAMLWMMPVWQSCFLVFFILDVMWQFWWDWSLLGPCFITGLLGGTVYVNAFTRIANDFSDGNQRELALSAASAGDSFGTMLSDASGLVIQGCLYKYHGLPGATIQ